MARDNAAAVEDLRRFIEQRNETVRALVEEVRGTRALRAQHP